MLKGYNIIGDTEIAEGEDYLQAFSPTHQKNLPEKFIIATEKELETAVTKSVFAFDSYKNKSAQERAIFLEAIAEEIDNIGNELIDRAKLETGLTEQRLTGERGRTTGQLKLFAELLREGSWVEAVIDEALPNRKPFPRSDLRKMNIAIGPVAVFGASNFPFAFSTAGGDTASALAAGNPVIVKAHPSHLGTNELMGTAIKIAAEKCNMPDGVFSFVIGDGSKTGLQLVKNPGIKAVGFTGSYRAGMAIYKTATNEREIPIPVFAEMSSINPVLLLPAKLKQDADALVIQLAGSISLGVGQFCTNPGLLFLIADENFDGFTTKLKEALTAIPEAPMLNQGICNSYYMNRQVMAKHKGVTVLYMGEDGSAVNKGSSALFQVNAKDFIQNQDLQNEVFGPASLIVKCEDERDLLKVLKSLHGQLTCTVFGDSADILKYAGCIEILTGKAGRLIFNGVPTGVEVSYAMVHGGPFPATTDARSTSVGADAIKRFLRPVCFQDCPQDLLPDALKNENPLGILRKINGRYTRESI
ncbi:MAG TPA: aldehyde dehydrogenase (NADP(+)) [Puia sp.]|jgi:NADP-dependent aldehyde dehydrogenase|nr:aldehyde dehydrogenase (NADP(+)) [Puia sp.]